MGVRFSIRTKLALCGAAILAPLLLAGPGIHAASRDIADGVRSMSRLDGAASAALQVMALALARTGRVLDDDTAEPVPASLERLRAEERDFRGALRTWRTLAHAEPGRALTGRVEQAYDAYVDAARTLVQARGDGAAQLATVWRRAVEARQAVDAVLDRDVGRHMEAEAARLHAEVLQRVRHATRGLFLLVLATAALAWLAAAVTARSLRRPLAELLDTIEAMRAGDLSRRAAARSTDETADVVAAFNRMADHLQSTAISRRDELGQAMACLKLDLHRLRDELHRTDAGVAARVRPRIQGMLELIDESVRTGPSGRGTPMRVELALQAPPALAGPDAGDAHEPRVAREALRPTHPERGTA